VTSTERWCRPLAPASRLESAARFWIGTLQRGDEDAVGSARLYRELLEQSVDALPPGITKLVVIPDGVLHRLPFDALRARTEAAPVVERFEITLAPSAAVWLLLRHGEPVRGDARALLLADPEFPGASAWPEELRSAWRSTGALGRLPFAREEARRALSAVRGRGELRLDDAASEAYLKGAASRFRVLHLAAHAIVDADEPARSAVLLAPGGAGEDGLLQAREVADLDLHGATVVLSACRSAGGAEIAGEGVMGLARAFFLARAGAVVGSLWPVRDRDAAALMDAFYRQLSRGAGPSAALARAKRELARRGDPAGTWAGFVVLGAGQTPIWPGAAARAPWAVWTALGVGALALAALAWRRRSRFSRA